MANATGWNEMIDGNLIKASFVMFDTAWQGWTVGILFFTFQFMLLLKTRNINLSFVTSLIFASLYLTSAFVEQASSALIMLLLLLELGGTLYLVFFK